MSDKSGTAAPPEQACVFGVDHQMAGVYSPAAGAPFERPCSLFLSAGLLHHVGPTRLHVELARRLAEHGVSGLRFDLSGVGDSETSSLGGYFMERSAREIREAMDFLESTHGHRSFVLIGLCSGADDALATARSDERVVGIVLLNGDAYPAGWFRLHRLLKFYLPRLLMWQKLRSRSNNALWRMTGGRLGLQSSTTRDRDDQQAIAKLDEDYRYIPPQRDTESILASLAQSGTDLLFIYTGSEHDVYTYQGQLFAMFPSLRNLTQVSERYLQEADHTLILMQDRNQVVSWVCQWFTEARFARQST